MNTTGIFISILACALILNNSSFAQQKEILLWPNNPSASKEKSTGAAIIVAPGGGHRELWIDHEGYRVAKWFSDRGIAVFVLKYRLARRSRKLTCGTLAG